MQKKSVLQSGIFNTRVIVAVLLFSIGASFGWLGYAGPKNGQTSEVSRKKSSAPNQPSAPDAPNRIAASQPPFTPIPNTVSGGGLTIVAKMFAPNGWVKPGDTFPIVITYQAGGTGSVAANISVTLHAASIFLNSTPAASPPLNYPIPALLPNANGQIVIEARAKNLTEDPEVMWKDLSADVSLQTTGPALLAKTRGPKVTTHETARFGDRPFPIVMVQYQDVRHCVGVDQRANPVPGGPPIPADECDSNHTAEALDTSVNSRTTGKSVWQLYQDMSFGQLYPDGKVSPAPNSPDTAFATTPPGHVYKWSTLDPNGTCSGTTLAPPTGTGTPAYLNRIEGGWYLLPGNQGYYGADRTGHALAGALTGQGLLFGIDDACGPTGKITYDAAALADPDIDYNDFDTDKDGLVDFFNLMFAGDGGNGTTTPSGLNNVWPHSSDLRQYFTDTNGETGYVSNDQFRNRLNQPMFWTNASRTEMTTDPTSGIKVFVRVGPYNVNPESAVDSVSVIAHEYGHSLGLPDFYSTGTRATYGSWELMGSDHFQYMTVFSRQDLGWVVPRPLTTGEVTLKESKFDTGEIYWTRPDGTPYTLTGPGIHNGDVYRLQLPPRILIDEVPSGVRAWYSQAGNQFGCANDGGGHNLDFFIPDLQQHEGATVTLKFKHFYEIEWDYDYAFVLVSRDGGRTWASLPSVNGTTTPNAINPNANSCQTTYNNGITGVSDGDPLNDTEKRALGDYSGAMFIDDQFDMSAYAGDNVILRFSYSTDPGLAKRGWFIDDIEITAGSTVVYKSDFEAGDERTRIFPDGWVRASSAEGSPADHAYYLELRDRISNDFDGKGQSDRGAPNWQGGVSMIYTDEAHGYGNFGTDDPPAQTPVDSAPQPGNATPNLDDAAFTLSRPQFNGCTHIENYDAEPGTGTTIPWKLPPYLRFTVTGLTGMTGPSAPLPPTPAMATLVADIYPNCDLELGPPTMLATGADYENPDTDGSYTLSWTRPAAAAGPDVLQVATTCSPFYTEDAESGIGQWTASTEGIYTGVPWGESDEKPMHNSTVFRTRAAEGTMNASAILTHNTPFVIPDIGTTTLSWDDWNVNEGDDVVYVEVSENGTNWIPVYVHVRAAAAQDAALAFANEPLFPHQVDLTDYSGKSIRLRFRYTLGPDNRATSTPNGWYIDNIKLTNADWTDVITTSGTSFLEHKASGSYCYRVRTTFLVGGHTPLASTFSNVVGVTVAPGVRPVVSRKMHGAAGIFDLDLPKTGSPGVECRIAPGADANKHQVVFFFAAPVTVGNATVTPGPGATAERDGSGPPSVSLNGREVTVNLKNVSNAQRLTVNLLNVVEGGPPKTVSVPMSVLGGDSTANGVVSNTDVASVKAQVGAPASSSNFRFDVNVSGAVTNTDVSITKTAVGTSLP